MIGFDLTQEQENLRDLVHEFAREVIRPAAPEYDEIEQTPWPIMQEAHELGAASDGQSVASWRLASGGGS
jgi:acyl-CoA dehydrogenase